MSTVPLHLHRCTKCQGIDSTWGPDGLCAGGTDDCDLSHRGVLLCLVSAVDGLFCGGHYEQINPADMRATDPVFSDRKWRHPVVTQSRTDRQPESPSMAPTAPPRSERGA